MNEYKFSAGDAVRLFYKPKSCALEIRTPDGAFRMSDEAPYAEVDVYGHTCHLSLTGARRIHIEEYRSAAGDGIRTVYESFYIGNRKLPFSIDTLVRVEAVTGKVIFEAEITGDEPGNIRELHWPQSFEFDDSDPEAYTVIPMMQGTLIPSKWRNTVRLNDGRYYHHDGYMPWFGQRWGKQGYLMITRTADDAGYCLDHLPGARTRISNVWYPSLSQMRYRRICEVQLFGKCDYNSFCQSYRLFARERGGFMTLEEKTRRNPLLKKRIGAPLIQDYILASADPTSRLYSESHPEWNRHFVTFAQRAEQLKKLHSMGVERALVHLDGCGQYGYDSGHPDIFPPHDEVGGTAGMKELLESCHALGYTVDLHDQYRDFYRNSPSFGVNQAVEDAENNLPCANDCYGGEQNYLCAGLAMPYIRRNYLLLERSGLRPDGVHLASFSGGNLDECHSPLHRMSRSECISFRKEAFGFLHSRGYLTCSDEPTDCMLDMLDTVIHAPYSLTPVEWDGMSNGIPVPLFSIVYHDALLVPWFGNRRQSGGWGIPNSDNALTHAILNASPAGLETDATPEETAKVLKCCKIAEKLAFVPITRHELVSEDQRCQRMVYADGTVIEANFNTDETKIHN